MEILLSYSPYARCRIVIGADSVSLTDLQVRELSS